jgi:hypothetical protein
MAPRKHRTTTDLGEAKRQLISVKTLAVSMGMPMARVRTLDDAISVIEQIEERTKKNV